MSYVKQQLANGGSRILAYAIKSALASLQPKKTNWRIRGYDGISASIGTAGLKAQIGGSLGVLSVQQPGGPGISVTCLGFDGSIGLSCSPVSADASLPGTPAIPGVMPALSSPTIPAPPGINPGVYSLPASLGIVTPKSFRGGLFALNLAVSVVATANLNFLFMGSVYRSFPLSSSPAFSAAAFCSSVILTSQVLVVVPSFSCSLPDVSATLTWGQSA